MIPKAIVGLVTATLIFSAVAAAETGEMLASRCGGGDGPKPIVDISHAFPADVKPVPTDGEVSEFLVWEGRQRIAYRNGANQVQVTSPTGDHKSYVSSSTKAISRVTDAEERFLLTEGDSWIIDAFAGNLSWLHFKLPLRAPHHLFWEGTRLYSMQAAYDADGDQRVYLYKYRAGDNGAKRICPLLKFTAGDGYHIGQGHSYPYAVMYRTVEKTKGKQLTVALVNVANCHIETKTYADLIEGQVEDVYWYRDMRSVLVKIDHPDKQLMWDTGSDAEHCHYYKIGNAPVLVLNNRHPVVGTFLPNEGLTLLYLHDLDNKPAKTATILKGMPIEDIRPQDVQLMLDGRTLYVAPQLVDKQRYLMRVELPPNPR